MIEEICKQHNLPKNNCGCIHVEIDTSISPKSQQRPEVACSEWVDELTAARDSLDRLGLKHGNKMTPWDCNALYRAWEVLDKLIATEPRHSSTRRR